MFYYGKAKDRHFEYSHIFWCELWAMPFRYLGIPIHHKRLSNSDWKDVLDKFQKRQVVGKANCSLLVAG
jgi:hypothetical protein